MLTARCPASAPNPKTARSISIGPREVVLAEARQRHKQHTPTSKTNPKNRLQNIEAYKQHQPMTNRGQRCALHSSPGDAMLSSHDRAFTSSTVESTSTRVVRYCRGACQTRCMSTLFKGLRVVLRDMVGGGRTGAIRAIGGDRSHAAAQPQDTSRRPACAAGQDTSRRPGVGTAAGRRRTRRSPLTVMAFWVVCVTATAAVCHQAVAAARPQPAGAGQLLYAPAQSPKVPSRPSTSYLELIPSDRQIEVIWREPNINRSAITRYRIAYGVQPYNHIPPVNPQYLTLNLDSSSLTTHVTGSTTTFSATLTGLTNGSRYSVQVKAANAVGWGQYSYKEYITPAVDPAGTPPSKPTNLKLAVHDKALYLRWSGNWSSRDFDVQYRKKGNSGWSEIVYNGNRSYRRAAISGLTTGDEYEVRIRGNSTRGIGPWSDTSSATTNKDRAALEAIYASSGGSHWSYSYRYYSGKWNDDYKLLKDWYRVDVDSTSGRVSDVSLRYQTLMAGLPAEIGDLTGLTALDLRSTRLSALLKWQPAALDNLKLLNDDALTELVLRSNSLISVPTVIEDLTNLTKLDLEYNSGLRGALPSWFSGLTKLEDFQTYGTNLCVPASLKTWYNGITTKDSLDDCTTVSIPTPSTPNLLLDDRKITVFWKAPTNNGVPITRYKIGYGESSGSPTHEIDLDLSSSTDLIVDDGNVVTVLGVVLENGTTVGGQSVTIDNNKTHYVWVKAGASSSWGSYSSRQSGTPKPPSGTKPVAPSSLKLAAHETAIYASWGSTSYTQDYNVEYRKKKSDGTWPTTWTQHTHNGTYYKRTAITGLTLDSVYQVRVKALGSAGEGPWSTTKTATTSKDRAALRTLALDTALDISSWRTDGADDHKPLSEWTGVTVHPERQPVVKVTVTSTCHAVVATWTVDGRSGAITEQTFKHKAGYSGSLTTATVTASARSHTISTAPQWGQTYYATVTAYNNAGSHSHTASATTPGTSTCTGTPGEPVVGVTVEATCYSVVATWTVNDKKAAINRQVLRYRTGSGNWTAVSPAIGIGARSHTIAASPQTGTAYSVEVTAQNSAGSHTHTGSARTPVACSAEGRVSELDIDAATGSLNNKTFSAEIKDLKELITLKLDNTSLKDMLTSRTYALDNLTLPPKLATLDLRSNSLISVPDVVTRITTLAELDIRYNSVTEIPAAIGGLTELRTLDFYDNKLTGPIPKQIKELTNLHILNLGSPDSSSNRLTGPIIGEIGSLANLTELNLRYNDLAGSVPGALDKLTALETLNLRDNKRLYGPLPSTLHKLTAIKTLYFVGGYSTKTQLCMPRSLRYQPPPNQSQNTDWYNGITNKDTTLCAASGAPGKPVLIPGDQKIEAIWTAPSVSSSKPAATQYNIKYAENTSPKDSGGISIDCPDDPTATIPTGDGLQCIYLNAVDTDLSAHVNGGTTTLSTNLTTGLANATLYYVWVRAKNSQGWSPYSSYNSITPDVDPAGDPPVTVGSIKAAEHENAVYVSWTKPSSGDPIDYDVRYRAESPVVEVTVTATCYSVIATWTVNDNNGAIASQEFEHRTGNGIWKTVAVTAGARSHTITTNPKNSETYGVRVSATDSTGASSQATIGSGTVPASVTCKTVAQPVVEVLVTATCHSVVATWTVDDRGAAITGQTLEHKTGGGSWTPATVTAGTRSFTVTTSPANSTAYHVRVTATNSVGSTEFTGRGTTPDADCWTDIVYNGNKDLRKASIHNLATDTAHEVQVRGNNSSGLGAWPAAPAIAMTSKDRATLKALSLSTALDISSWRTSGNNDHAPLNEWSGVTVSGTPRYAPVVSAVKVAATCYSVTATWAVNDRGAALDDQILRYKIGSSGTWTTVSPSVSTEARSHTIATVTTSSQYGKTYYVEVTAVNSAGSSTSSTTKTVPSSSSCKPAVSVTVSVTCRSVIATWTVDDKGAALTSQTLRYKVGSSGTWTTISNTSITAGTARSHTITTFSTASEYGKRYYVEVTAVSSAGSRIVSSYKDAPSSSNCKPDITNVTVTASCRSVIATWTVNDRGAALSSQALRHRAGTTGNWTRPTITAGERSHTIATSPQNNTTYYVRVTSVNAAGSETYAASSTTPTTSTCSSNNTPAVDVTVRATCRSVVATWTVNDRGSAINRQILRYKLNNSHGDSVWTTVSDTSVENGTARSHVITTNPEYGTKYYVEVSATNGQGNGTDTSNTTTPSTCKPSVNVTVKATCHSVIATWTADDSSAVITGQILRHKTGTGSWTAASPAIGVADRSYTITTSPKSSTNYYVELTITNNADSHTYTVNDATPYTKYGTTPGNCNPDVGVTVTATCHSVVANWTVDDKSAAITGQTLRHKTRTSPWKPVNITATDRSHTITTIPNNSEIYRVEITAVNSAGSSSSVIGSGIAPAACATKGRVSGIDIPSSNLSGKRFPAAIGDLSELLTLNLDSVSLKNTLNSQADAIDNLAAIPRLTTLSMRSNSLTSTPAVVTSLTTLAELDVSSNNVTAIPADTDKLINLRTLNFRNNKLTGAIPADISRLTNLQTLDLGSTSTSYNQLSGRIPDDLDKLTTLVVLNLERNQLTGRIPTRLGGLTNLEILNLRYNKLTGGVPAEFGALANLTELDLSYNRRNSTNHTYVRAQPGLTGGIPARLGDLANLVKLDLSYNGLNGSLPEQLSRLTALRTLNLNENRQSYNDGTNNKWRFPSWHVPEEFTNLTALTKFAATNSKLCILSRVKTGWYNKISSRSVPGSCVKPGKPSARSGTNAPALLIAGHRSISMQFAAPTSPSKTDKTYTPITDYEFQSAKQPLRAYDVSGEPWFSQPVYNSTDVEITGHVKNIDNNFEYRVRARAKNAEGNGPWLEGTITPNGNTPGVPDKPDVTRMWMQRVGYSNYAMANISWTQPAGPTPTGYDIEYGLVATLDMYTTSASGLSAGWLRLSHSVSNDRRAKFRVRGRNGGNRGPWSAYRETSVPGRPDAPTPVSGHEDAIYVSWTAPSDAGYPANIDGYRLRYREEGTSTWYYHCGATNWCANVTGDTKYKIQNLAVDTVYEVQVRAHNEVDFGPWSPTVTAMTSKDRSALAAIYDTTDGANWTASTNWKDDYAPLADWHGVTVANYRVSELDLDNNNLDNGKTSTTYPPTLPDDIIDLVALIRLSLKGNADLEGPLPQKLDRLMRLATLNAAGSGLCVTKALHAFYSSIPHRDPDSNGNNHDIRACEAPSTSSAPDVNPDEQRLEVVWAPTTSRDIPADHYDIRHRVNRDNNITFSTISPTALEGGTGTYHIRLKTAPIANVVITLTTTGDPDITVDTDPATVGDQNTLTFTPLDWASDQTVTLAAAQDIHSGDDSTTIIHTITTTDSTYAGTIIAIAATEIDDDSLRLAATALTDTSATLTLTGHTGDWWLRETAPTVGACVSKGNTVYTEDLSSLTAGTDYTYTAYSGSTCFPSQELAVVSFTASDDTGWAVQSEPLASLRTVSQRDPRLTVFTPSDPRPTPLGAAPRYPIPPFFGNKTTYDIQLSACNSEGCGGWSPTVSETTTFEPLVCIEATPLSVDEPFLDASGDEVPNQSEQLITSWARIALTKAWYADVTVDWSITGTAVFYNGSNNSQGDYTTSPNSTTGTATIPAGERYAMFTITTRTDGDATRRKAQPISGGEGLETVVIRLSSPTNATMHPTKHEVTVGIKNRLPFGAPTVVPKRPTNLAAAAGDQSVTLTWDDPSNTSIQRYEYRLNHNSTGNNRWTGWSGWTTMSGSGSGTTSHTFTGLTNDKTYRYQLRAVNAVGPSAKAPSNAVYVEAIPISPPEAPTGLTATARDKSVVLAWSNPNDASITGYEYQMRNHTAGGSWSAWTDVPSSDKDTVTYTETGVANRVMYQFRVRAVNVGGDSPASSVVSATPVGPPEAPTGLTATARDKSVVLAWDNPSDPSITGYEYQMRNHTAGGNWSAWTDVPSSDEDTVTYTETGLTNDNEYQFRLRAVNVHGDSPAAPTTSPWYVSATPFSPPEAPTGLTATAGDKSVVLAWSNPSDASITGYEYQMRKNVAGQTWSAWTDVPSSDKDTVTYTETGLTNDDEYQFRLRAVNVHGNSPAAPTTSPWYVAATPIAPPEAPTGLTATAGDKSVVLAWSNPSDASITGYEYQMRKNVAGQTWSAWTDVPSSDKDTVTYTATGLTNGDEYQFRLRAVNAVGNSPATPVVVATPPTGPPAAPTGLTATAGDQSVALAWSDPSDSSITGYEYRMRNHTAGGGWSAWTAVPTSDKDTVAHTETGLTNNNEYRFKVRAVNAKGNSPAAPTTSPSYVTATPITLPSAPAGLKATAGDQSVVLAWSNPSDASITGYEYQVLNHTAGGSWSAWAAVPSSDKDTVRYTETGLTSGDEYWFKVRAVNAVGNSPASSIVVATPPTSKPAAPTGLTATAGNGSVVLAWDDPSDSSITGYEYQVRRTGGGWSAWTDVPSSDKDTVTYTETGLTSGIEYRFKVRAVNAKGNSPAAPNAAPWYVSATPN